MCVLIATLWVGISLGIAVLTLIELAMVGFPDGYISPYARETGPILKVLATVSIMLAAGTAYLGIVRRQPTTHGIWLALWLLSIGTVAALLALPACPRSAACAAIYQQTFGKAIDDGQGG